MSAKDDSASPVVEAGLDDRKAAILRAIVEQYVASAQPVGSSTVTRTADLGVSAATVRNEMSLLEREGYIAQPHTSAGRVPTDRGYRYYVDHLAGVTALAAPERRRIAEFFTTATMAMDELLLQTSQLLARVTDHAAVVVGPQSETVVIRGAHLALLQPRVALAVVILSNGAVEKQVVYLDEDISEADVAAASARLARTLDGRRLADLADLAGIVDDGPNESSVADRLARASHAALRTHVGAHSSEPLYVGGASRIAAEQEAFSGPTVARLIELLEHHVVLSSLHARAARARAHRAHRIRERERGPAGVLARARPVPRRRGVDGYRRRARTDPHGLPQGASGRRDRVPTARPATLPVTPP